MSHQKKNGQHINHKVPSSRKVKERNSQSLYWKTHDTVLSIFHSTMLGEFLSRKELVAKAREGLRQATNGLIYKVIDGLLRFGHLLKIHSGFGCKYKLVSQPSAA